MSPEGSYVAWSWEVEVEELVIEISTNHGAWEDGHGDTEIH